MKPLRFFLLLLLLAVPWTLGACSLTPREAPLPETLAFPPGPPAPGGPPAHLPPLVVFRMTAPAWLESRLLYVRRPGSLELTARRSAVWITPLPDFLTASLREMLLPREAAGSARLALHVHLFDVEEIRSTPRRVVLVARARLVSLLPGVPDRVRLWRLGTQAEDGPGGEARAIVNLDRRFNRAVLLWLSRLDLLAARSGKR